MALRVGNTSGPELGNTFGPELRNTFGPTLGNTYGPGWGILLAFDIYTHHIRLSIFFYNCIDDPESLTQHLLYNWIAQFI
jgi:hypothetical protein